MPAANKESGGGGLITGCNIFLFVNEKANLPAVCFFIFFILLM